MSGIILSVNAGSSSLKVSIYGPTVDGPKHLATASVSDIKSKPSFKSSNKDVSEEEQNPSSISDHGSALKHVLDHFFRTTIGKEDVTHVCHRVVHGGEYENRVVINNETLHYLDELCDLAPLHNTSAVSLIRACLEELPGTKSIAYFDTTFHQSIAPHIQTLAFDQSIAKEYKMRKYGFHGISYAFILRSVAQFLSKPEYTLNLIVLHLGSGASASCIKDGKSLDTSMSLTPVDGLPGASRTGAIDPTAILHHMKKSGTSVEEAETILNSKSGWKAMTGTSSFGDIVDSKDDKCKLAFDLFVDRIMNYVGAYWLKLGGQVDALVFAGGIGEKSWQLRKRVADQCYCLGVRIDGSRNGTEDENELSREVRAIGDGPVKTLVVQTDEQYEMARQCVSDRELYQS